MKLSIPQKLLYECEGFQLMLEMDNGNKVRGRLMQMDDLMNMTMDDVVLTDPEGHNTKVERMLIRGSQIQFVILPPILRQSPFLKNKTDEKYHGLFSF